MTEVYNEKQMECLVTVIVATYNPQIDKLLVTLRSILEQQQIDMEIIVADDGSKLKYEHEIKDLFKEYNFLNFQLVFHTNNTGTCSNYYGAIQCAKGKYIKLLSPGDYFNSAYALCQWVGYMESNRIAISYSNIVCYQYKQNGNIKICLESCVPQLSRDSLSDHYKKNAVLLENLFLRDCPVGAAVMVEHRVIQKYLGQLIGTVKYSEDNYLRLALLDGERLCYYPFAAVCYEYGSGISTNGADKWEKIIFNEFIKTYELAPKIWKPKTFFEKRLHLLICLPYRSRQYTFMKYIIFPSLIILKLRKEIHKQYSSLDVDKEYLRQIHKYIISIDGDKN